MLQKERLERIRQTVRQEKKVSVSELSKCYGVTEETIRRDLEKLEGEGILARTYGGAVLNQEESSEYISYLRRAQTNVEEKALIGRLAAKVIPQKATIGADASSTVMEAVRMLKDRPEITVLTNSVKIIRELDQADLTLVTTGGVVNGNTYSMQGLMARKALLEYNVEIVLISCKALGPSGGVYDSNEEEGELKKILIGQGQTVILLVDHTKFGKVAFMKFFDLDRVNVLITDQKPSEEWIRLCREKNVKLIYE